MVGLAFIWWFAALSSNQEWRQRPLDSGGGDPFSRFKNIRHDQSFY
jgi:hypothetical protein